MFPLTPLSRGVAVLALLCALAATAGAATPDSGPKAEPPSCAAYLEAIHDALRPEEPLADWRTVWIIGQADGRWGPLWILERDDGQPWGSRFGTYAVAPQGDPRHFIDSVGEDVAGFFGFHPINDVRMTAAGDTELNGALTQLNRWLPAGDAVPTRFYVSRTQAGFAREYVRRFGVDGEIPIAPDGTTQIHDLSTHVGTLFVPRPLLLHGQAQSRAVSRFDRFVQETMPAFAQSAGGHGLRRRLILCEVQHIDGGTALAAGVFAPIPSPAGAWTAYEMLSNRGASPREHVEQLLTEWKSYGTTGRSEIPLTAAETAALPELRRAFARFTLRERALEPGFDRRLQIGGRDFLVDAHADPFAWLRQYEITCQAYRIRREQLRNTILANGGGNMPLPASRRTTPQ